MNKATAKALEQSIKHWERMRDGKRHKTKDDTDNSIDGLEVPMAEDCALCRKFDCQICEGCPVMNKTGKDNCDGSPYWKARYAFNERGVDSPEFKAAAQKMIDFLESLREPTQREG